MRTQFFGTPIRRTHFNIGHSSGELIERRVYRIGAHATRMCSSHVSGHPGKIISRTEGPRVTELGRVAGSQAMHPRRCQKQRPGAERKREAHGSGDRTFPNTHNAANRTRVAQRGRTGLHTPHMYTNTSAATCSRVIDVSFTNYVCVCTYRPS